MLRLIILIVLLPVWSPVQSQVANSLHVGDPAPTFNPYKWIKGEPIKKFANGKVYVVEFGATWCSPCIAMIPHLSALSDKYKGTVEVISIFVMEENKEPLQTENPTYISRVESFISKRNDKVKYTVAVDAPEKTIEKSWLRAAGKTGIPYTFVVDKNGRISDVTNGIVNIQKAIEVALASDYDIKTQVEATKKTEAAKTPWDYHKLLLVDGNGGQPDNFMFRSLITKYEGDIPKRVSWYISSGNWAQPGSDAYLTRGMFQSVGMTVADMYRLAYGDTLTAYPSTRFKSLWPDTVANPYLRSAYGRFWFDPIIEVTDKSPFITSTKSILNRFNYSTKVPIERSSAKLLQQVMRSDIYNYFGYDVLVEERVMPCWNLILLPGAPTLLKIATPGKIFRAPINDDIPNYPRRLYSNATVRDVIGTLSTVYGFGMFNQGVMEENDIAPFFDETNYHGEFDFVFEPPFSSSFEIYRKYLNTIGIDIVKGARRMKVIIIRDPLKP